MEIMKNYLICSLITICGLTVSYAEDTNNIKMCGNPPVLDGKLSDKCWNRDGMKIKHPFRKLPAGAKVADTEVKVTFTPKYLYIGFICKHPYPEKINRDKHGRITNEDRVEIFCDPGTGGKEYYHFNLSSNGNRYQQVVSSGNKSRKWNCDWKSATSYTKNGWEAEVAIPMKLFAKSGDLKNFKANFSRNAFISGKQASFSWMPVKNGFHEPQSFGNLIGIFNIAEKLRFGKVTDRYGKKQWALQGIFTPPAKNSYLVVEVCEYSKDGSKSFRKRRIRKRRPQAFILSEMRKCRFQLDLSDSKSGELLQTVSAVFNPVDLVSCCPGKSYYTDEKNADIIIDSRNLPMKIIYVSVKNHAGKYLVKKQHIKGEVISFSAEKLVQGKNKLIVEVMFSDNEKPVSVPVTVIKRKPFPGHEVKTDRIKGIVEVNGKPYFPIGIIIKEEINYEEVMKRIKESNNNTIVNWRFKNTNPEKISKVCKVAKKYGFKTIDKIYNYTDSNLGERSGSKKFPENFKRNLPLMRKGVEAIKDLKSLLAYVTFDEPSSRHEVPGKILYDMTNAVDGYHPVWCNYNRVPGKLDNTDWYDIICRDIYWNPGEKGKGIGRVAKESAKMEMKAAEIHKPMWTLLMTSRVADCRRRILLPCELRCQVYSTVINGAKGIVYFSETLIQHADTWKALKNINAQMKKLSPAILNNSVEQKIKFSPGKENDPAYDITNIQARIFKTPENEYILLLTNIRYFPVDITINIQGLDSAARMFVPGKSSNGKISETIEPCGVRAYKLRGKFAEPISVSIHMKSNKSGRILPLENVPRSGRLQKKNLLPNPSFETETVRNWPDYYSGALLKYPDIGGANQKWGTVEEQVFHGRKCVKIILNGKNMLATYHCPPHGTYTISAWIKTDNPDIKANFVAYGRKQKSPELKLTKQWKRYSFVLKTPKHSTKSGLALCFNGKGTVWIDAIQLEKGDTPTAFEE